MRELTSLAAVVEASGGDPLLRWAAQELRPGARAWALGDAVAVACARLSTRARREAAAWVEPSPRRSGTERPRCPGPGPTHTAR